MDCGALVTDAYAQVGDTTVKQLCRNALNCTAYERRKGGPDMPDAPVIETMKFTEARQQLSRVVNRVARRETRILLEKSGVPVAAIVSADDLRRLDEMEARRHNLSETMSRTSDAFADVPKDELERELAKAQAAARAELRAEREAATSG